MINTLPDAFPILGSVGRVPRISLSAYFHVAGEWQEARGVVVGPPILPQRRSSSICLILDRETIIYYEVQSAPL